MLDRFGKARTEDDLAAAIQEPKFRTAAEAWQPETGNVLLLGESGLGKTTAVGLLLRRIIRLGVRDGGPMWDLARGIAWAKAPAIEEAVRNHPFGRGECPLLSSLRAATITVIDDIGWQKENNPKHIMDVMGWRSEVPGTFTFCTSGLSFGEFREALSEAVVRRIATTHGAKALVVSAFPNRDAEDAAKKRGLRGVVASPAPFSEAGER